MPLAARLVEVIADRGDAATARYVYGSGCIVRGRLVLTAAHVVAGARRVQVRDPNKRLYSATVDPRFVGDANGPGPDLALVEIDDPDVGLPPLGLARVDRRSPRVQSVKECHAIGYPWFAETPSPTAMRDTVDAEGIVPTLSKLAAGLLSVQVNNSPRPLPPEDKRLAESEWSGMSGAPVVAADRLLGVVTEHAPREGPSAITAVPLTALEQDPANPKWGPGVTDPSAWWARLGVTGLPDLQPVPALPERPTPAYWATVREFGRTLHHRMPQLLGREREFAELEAFATGPAGYRWLVGGAYAGKTALLYEAVTAGLPEEVDVVCYFLSCRASDADSSRFLAAVVPQLAYLCELDPPVGDRDQFYALWERATERAAETGRPLLLVVDGLDEDSRPAGLPSVASLLPAVEGRAHVLVSSRPYPELPDDVEDEDPLKSTATRMDLTPFKGAKELAELARQEIYDLTHGTDVDTAVEVLGLLTAAAGPLSVQDLATLSDDLAAPSAGHRRRVRRLVTEQAARSLEPVGPSEQARWQFAHFSLLKYARANQDLADPEYRNQIHRWAEEWRDRGWPTAPDVTESTPRYLLDEYPATLADDPNRLTALVSDVGWVDAAIQSTGVDRVLADLRRAAAADPAEPAVKAMLATVSGQAHHLRSPSPLTQAGYVLRQLCLQAAELGEDPLAANLRARLRSLPDPGPVPLWTTRRANRALIADVGRRHDRRGRGRRVLVAALPDGRVVSGGEGGGQLQVWSPREPGARPVELSVHDDFVSGIDTVLWVAVAVLSDGRIISGSASSYDGRVRMWDPNSPEAGPIELGRQDPVLALAALQDRRVASADTAGRLLVWKPDQPGAEPVELGRHRDRVSALAGLPDGRVVSGDEAGRLLVWNPFQPGAEPVELGRHDGPVWAVAGLPDGRAVSGGHDGRVLVWELAVAGTAPVELGRHGGAVRAMARLRNGRVVSGGDDRRVLVWIPDSPGTGLVELGRHDDWVSTVAELPNGQVVSGDEAGRLLVWDPEAPGVRPVESGVHVGEVLAMAALQDGRVVGCDDAGRLQVWDPAAGDAQLVEIGRHDRRAQAVEVLRSGRVVSGDDAGRLLVWKIDEPAARPVELVGHSDAVQAAAVLQDGRLVSGDHAGRLLVWEHPDEPEARPRKLGYHGGWVSGLVALRDGWVVSGGYDGEMHGVSEYAGRLRVWDPDALEAEPVELGSHRARVRAVAELRDGRVVSGWADGRVLVWDRSAAKAEPIEVGRHDGSVEAVAVLPNGQVLTGGDDRSVRLWDVQTRQCSWSVACSVRALAAVVLSSGETLLVIAHQGTGVSTWSVREASPRAPQQ